MFYSLCYLDLFCIDVEYLQDKYRNRNKNMYFILFVYILAQKVIWFYDTKYICKNGGYPKCIAFEGHDVSQRKMYYCFTEPCLVHKH